MKFRASHFYLNVYTPHTLKRHEGVIGSILLSFRSVGDDLDASSVAQFIGKVPKPSKLMRLGV